MKRSIPLILLIFFFAGCSGISSLKRLLVLKGYGDNKEQQDVYVEEHKRNFKKLISVIEDERISEFDTKDKVLEAFGDPVFSKQKKHKGKVLDQCLYRHPLEYIKASRVYFYFNDNGKLEDLEYLIP